MTTIRRERSQLTKAAIKAIAEELVAAHVESSASQFESVFTIKVLQQFDRSPTEGETDQFLKAVGSITKNLKRKAARSKE